MTEGKGPPISVCVGIASWKRYAVARLLAVGDHEPVFARLASRAVQIARESGGAVAVWPSRAPPALEPLADKAGVPLVRLEDGFLRSVGLGAEGRAPASIVVDRSGIHFDPRRPSDLEQILTHRQFDDALIDRATQLVEAIVTLGLTKYNLPGKITTALPEAGGRRTVLVAGQVEDDLSVRLGGAGVTGNLDLLRRVRALEPDAVVLYRPHPDVDAGHRKGALPPNVVLHLADHIVREAPLPMLLDRVDAVHTLTSLTGFEALLRGREVIVHGQPFYAGWGLTRDLSPPPRRGRKLSLAELAAGALILYPRYLDPSTSRPCPPETLVAWLAGAQAPSHGWIPSLRQAQGRFRRLAGDTRPAA